MILILDGYHRLELLKPKIIIMDILNINKEYSKYFDRFKYNPYFQKCINGDNNE